MYCLQCKRNTQTQNEQIKCTKNNRQMKTGNCVICGCKKSQFIGRGVVNKLINNLPFEMHLPGHNFTGPGTNLKKRLKPNLEPHEWSKPINRVDKAAYNHDVCYLKNHDTKTRNKVCDQDMI